MTNDLKSEKEQYQEWHDDPANWRAGIFYYNPKDKRIFPRKRIGIGWTINFANPKSVVVYIVMIGMAVVLSFLIFAITKK